METVVLPQGMYEFENAYLHLMVDRKARLLYSEWVRKPTGREYREAATILADLLTREGILFWIKETGRLGEVTDEELKWVLYQLLPIAASSPLKKLARLDTDDADMARFLKFIGDAQLELHTSIQVRQFKTYREAAEWIGQRNT